MSPTKIRKPAPKRARPRRPDPDLRAVSRRLRGFALSMPDATEDFPWGERVAKVRGKVFVFLGTDPVPGGNLGLSVKLPDSADAALAMPFAKPTGYGLGRSGWVTASFEPGGAVPIEVLEGWILESYRAIAGPKLSARLAEPRGGRETTSLRLSKDRRRN